MFLLSNRLLLQSALHQHSNSPFDIVFCLIGKNELIVNNCVFNLRYQKTEIKGVIHGYV
jgi:hypothetical protein